MRRLLIIVVTVLAVLAAIVIVIAPMTYRLVTGEYPPGYPLRSEPPPAATPAAPSPAAPPAPETAEVVPPGIEPAALARLRGFFPFFYEESRPPDLARLKEWGANAVALSIEDADAYAAEAKLFAAAGLGTLRPEPYPEPPPSLDLVATIRGLVFTAHRAGLGAQLYVTAAKPWLDRATEWQVEMVNLNEEADAWVPEALRTQSPAAVAATLSRQLAVLREEARKHYRGRLGIGFTNLVLRGGPGGRPSPQLDPALISVAGYDYLTINPHPDPSMSPEQLLAYIEASAAVARGLAARDGVPRVYLGALQVSTEEEPAGGWTGRHDYVYSDAAEAELYRQLFARTRTLLDGWSLQFSGGETRSAVGVISGEYRSGQ